MCYLEYNFPDIRQAHDLYHKEFSNLPNILGELRPGLYFFFNYDSYVFTFEMLRFFIMVGVLLHKKNINPVVVSKNGFHF